QNNVLITGGADGPGVSMTGGTLHLRNVTVANGLLTTDPGIKVTGGTIHIDSCTIENNKGGGAFIDGAAFTIKNTRVLGNGPGQFGLAAWGGILILGDLPSGSGLERVSVVDNNQVGISCATV